MEVTAKGLPEKGAVDVEGWEKRELVPPNAGEPSREGKCRWVRLSGGLERASWKFSDALLVDGSVLLVLGSGESRTSGRGVTSSLPLGGGATLFMSTPTAPVSPSGTSPFLKYFCSQEGTMLFTVSVTRLIRPGCCLPLA